MTETPDLGAVLRFYGIDPPNRGGNVQCLCPLDHERSPSASVDVIAGLWNCFSCGAGGDAYTLIAMREHHTEFTQTLKRYEEITGAPVQKKTAPTRPGRRGFRPKLRRRAV